MHIPATPASHFTPSTSRLWRAHRTAWVLALGIAATACGGGFDDRGDAASTSSAATTPAVASAKAVRQAAAPLSVEVEGCVLDPFYIPTTGTPVRALSADGRLLASALSDGQGHFRMRLPVHSEVVVQVDRTDGESLPMRVDAGAPTWATCLLDDKA